MIKIILFLLPVSCLSGYWDFLRTPQPGRLAHKMTVFVTNKTCSEDFILANSDEADRINACKTSCIDHKQCTAFTFLSRHDRITEVNVSFALSLHLFFQFLPLVSPVRVLHRDCGDIRLRDLRDGPHAGGQAGPSSGR